MRSWAPPPPLPLGLGSAAALRRGGQRRRWRAGYQPLAEATGDASPTPLVDAVRERGDRGSDVPFHVPGHKRGASTPAPLRPLLGQALKYDLTELAGLDYLAAPSGPIAESQALAAAAWGADASWLLVNGTTVGIHAAVMAACGGDSGGGGALLLARNAHLSAFNAMVLAGCGALYVQPEYDAAGFGVAHHVTPAALGAALQAAAAAGRRVGAVLVVSPTYFGVLSDIAGLAEVCHRHGVPLIVDEAHGAHLGLAPELPRSALQAGADVVVQSTHKQLSSMTQAAMLHLRGGRVCRTKLARALQVLQTSSPSYLLMASLDAARAQASNPAAFEECLAAAALARRRLAQLPGVRLLSAEHVGGSEGAAAAAGLDPLRLTLSFAPLGLSGYAAAEALEQRHGIVPELATPSCVVLALSIGSMVAQAEALAAAVEAMCAGEAVSGSEAAPATAAAPQAPQERQPPAAPSLLEPAVPPRAAFFAPSARMPAAEAVGRVCAELVCPYPPGVPVLFPGERITESILAGLQGVAAAGGRISGCADPTLQTIAVLLHSAEGEGLTGTG